MSFSRIPLKITRVFEIHMNQENTLAHKVGNNPLYTTVPILTSSAKTKFEGLNPATGHRYYPIDRIDDVGISLYPENGIMGYSTTTSKWCDLHPLKVLDFQIDGTSILSGLNVPIPLATDAILGLLTYEDATNSSSEVTNKIATPDFVTMRMKQNILTNLIVTTNLKSGSWHLDNDTSTVYASGSAVNVPAGSHVIHFESVTGYTTPADVSVTVDLPTKSVNACTAVHTTYACNTVKVVGLLNNAAGKWFVSGVGVRYSSGDSIQLAPGSYNIMFDDVSGKTTPSTQVLQIEASAETHCKEVCFIAYYT